MEGFCRGVSNYPIRGGEMEKSRLALFRISGTSVVLQDVFREAANGVDMGLIVRRAVVDAIKNLVAD